MAMSTKRDGTLARIGLIRGLLSTTAVIAALYGVMTGLLLWSGYGAAFTQYVIGDTSLPSLYWIPEVSHAWMAGGGTSRTLVAIVLAALNATAVTAAFTLLAFGMRAAIDSGRARMAARNAPEIASATATSGRQILDTPTCTLAIYDYSGAAILHPAPEAHLWLQRTRLKADFAVDTPLDRLRLALLEVLERHKGWTSGPEGHHANVDIQAHSLKVATMMIERVPDDPLAPIIGLAHDLGKIIAYQRETSPSGEKVWVKASRSHDFLSAHMVRVLPEFQALDPMDRRILIAVLSYSHGRDELPIGSIMPNSTSEADTRIRTLTRNIRAADGITTRADQATAADAVLNPNVMTELARLLPNAVMALNINRSIDPAARSDGFTSMARNYVAVLEAHLREKLAPLLSEETQKELAIRTQPPGREAHPSLGPILLAFRQMGWLIESYRDLRPDPPLFRLQSGNVHLAPVLLLSREALSKNNPDRVAVWGDAEYVLRVLKL